MGQNGGCVGGFPKEQTHSHGTFIVSIELGTDKTQFSVHRGVRSLCLGFLPPRGTSGDLNLARLDTDQA